MSPMFKKHFEIVVTVVLIGHFLIYLALVRPYISEVLDPHGVRSLDPEIWNRLANGMLATAVLIYLASLTVERYIATEPSKAKGRILERAALANALVAFGQAVLVWLGPM